MSNTTEFKEAKKRADSLPILNADAYIKIDNTVSALGQDVANKKWNINLTKDCLQFFHKCVEKGIEEFCDAPTEYGFPMIPIRKYLRDEEKQKDGRGKYGYVCVEEPTRQYFEDNDSGTGPC